MKPRCSQRMHMEQIHYHMSYKNSIISILKCQILYHSGDHEKHTLFLNPRGPCFSLVKPFSAFFFFFFFFVLAWDYRFYHILYF